jgi:UDP-glucose 4-epimerase
MRCLVTGGAGFIGSHIVDALIEAGHTVRVLDDLSAGDRANLGRVSARIEFMEGSVTEPAVVEKAVSGIEVVFHLAAMVSLPESFENPEKSWRINDCGTFYVYNAALDAGVKRLVFSSSSAVYGDVPPPHSEQTLPCPDSPYAIHKLLGEHYGRYCAQKGLEVVSLRYFNVYGPRQDPGSPYSGVVSVFSKKLSEGLPVTIYGDGSQSRDFIYVGDVAAANLQAAFTEGLSGWVFNIASGKSVTINEVYALLAERAGGSVPAPVYAPERPGEMRHSMASTEQAETILKFHPSTELRTGLAATYAWMTAPPAKAPGWRSGKR